MCCQNWSQTSVSQSAVCCCRRWAGNESGCAAKTCLVLVECFVWFWSIFFWFWSIFFLVLVNLFVGSGRLFFGFWSSSTAMISEAAPPKLFAVPMIPSNSAAADQGGPPWPSDALLIESNRISNRSNRSSQKFSNGRKIARMARILTIFGRNEPERHNLNFQKF